MVAKKLNLAMASSTVTEDLIPCVYWVLFCHFVIDVDTAYRFLLTAEGRSDVPQPRPDVALHEPGTLNAYTEHICRLEISQVKLVTYRVSLFSPSIYKAF